MGKDLIDKIPCCPELIKDDNCDELYFTRTLNYPILYKDRIRVNVQLILGFRLTRCTLGLVLGDPAYTTTLLPGEKVRLFTSDRRTQFTYDTETHLSYRQEQISEEKYFMTATQDYFSKYENSQGGTQTTTDKGKWNFKGDAEGSLGFLSAGASSSASGSHDNASTLDYLMTQTSNMRSSATQAVQATHVASSLSIGEVSTRAHAEGQTEDQFESSSREFSNENTSHAVTYIFYRLNKKQVLKFELVSIEKIITFGLSPNFTTMAQPQMSAADRKEISDLVTKQLIEAGILGNNGEISPLLKAKFDFHMEFSLPTAGIIVKGCLDECNTLEDERARYYKLKNDLLEKQIALLDKSQEYRCCPPAPIINDD